MEQFFSKIPSSYSLSGLLFFIGLGFGYLLRPSEKPRSVACAADIEAVRVCQDLLSGHQQRCATAVSEAADSCVEAQTVVCEEKMNQLSATLRQLDCAVCEAL